ncbi:MAG: tRNA (adenosine(37)-N6)-threonylcarbamoyltransferase complex ATPase subunit type 1 TsaE [Clostridiales bacterium]|nr:tRNA (adenosine(37)-N6)-threonylcarbamoyltransferase complex ATPase subunit type 1 TsaE [Clostridiales bacterium]
MEVVTINNLKETEKFAKKFAKLLRGGEIILLNGDLGAGKTTFTRQVLKALGVKGEVTSPTFTIMREYSTKKFNIYHFDMYRIKSPDEVREFGLEDYIYSGDNKSLVFIEWSENIREMLNGDFIEINISLIDDNKRKFEIIR